MTTTDDILNIIDGGLQHSDDPGTYLDPTVCWRCETNEPGDGASGVCDACRAWLLGDAEDEPASGSVVLAGFWNDGFWNVWNDIIGPSTAYVLDGDEWVEIGSSERIVGERPIGHHRLRAAVAAGIDIPAHLVDGPPRDPS